MHIMYQDYLGSLCEFSSETFRKDLSRFGSLQGRFECFKVLVQKILYLPFGLFFKFFITFVRAIGVLVGFAGLALRFRKFPSAKEFFIQRFVMFSRDIADWLALPFTLFYGLVRLLLGCIVHPALYFQ